MKKITFFTYDVYPGGGTERVMIMIANELAKHYQVDIISVLKSSNKSFYNIDKRIKVIDLDLHHTEPLIFKYLFLKCKIKQLLKEYKTDAFICAGMRYVPICDFMCNRTKFIAWEHYTSYINKKWSVGEIGRKIASKKADKVVVLTEKDREKNISLFNTPIDRIVHIYNANENKAFSNEYNINSKLIITAGRFNNQKGYDMLVNVAEKVFKKHPDWYWHIYGDGDLFEDIQRRIKDINIEKNLILKGLEKDLYSKYKDYSMYVLTSRYEGLGMVIVEAQNAKLPVVSFNCCCGPDELIVDDKNGYLIECFDIDTMAERINYLIDNPQKRLEMSNSSNLDKEKLDLNNITNKWIELIEK